MVSTAVEMESMWAMAQKFSAQLAQLGGPCRIDEVAVGVYGHVLRSIRERPDVGLRLGRDQVLDPGIAGLQLDVEEHDVRREEPGPVYLPLDVEIHDGEVGSAGIGHPQGVVVPGEGQSPGLRSHPDGIGELLGDEIEYVQPIQRDVGQVELAAGRIDGRVHDLPASGELDGLPGHHGSNHPLACPAQGHGLTAGQRRVGERHDRVQAHALRTGPGYHPGPVRWPARCTPPPRRPSLAGRHFRRPPRRPRPEAPCDRGPTSRA